MFTGITIVLTHVVVIFSKALNCLGDKNPNEETKNIQFDYETTIKNLSSVIAWEKSFPVFENKSKLILLRSIVSKARLPYHNFNKCIHRSKEKGSSLIDETDTGFEDDVGNQRDATRQYSPFLSSTEKEEKHYYQNIYKSKIPYKWYEGLNLEDLNHFLYSGRNNFR